MPNIANFTMKARISNETVADDIRELCLYMFDHRDGFPKSCLSSVCNPRPKPRKTAVPNCSDNMTGAMTPPHVEINTAPAGDDTSRVTLHAILSAVTVKMLDAKFSNQISAIFDTISVSVASSDKEKIHQLDNERQDLQAAIDMQMYPRGDNGHLNQPHYVSREFHSIPHTIHSSNAVTTQNRFAVLLTDD